MTGPDNNSTTNEIPETLSSSSLSSLDLDAKSLANLPEYPDKHHINLVQEMWKNYFEGHDMAVGSYIYRNLFQLSPELKVLFGRFPSESMSRAFVVMLGGVFNKLHIKEHLIPVLLQLGRRHKIYKVEDAHYDCMKVAIQDMLVPIVGAEWNSDLEESWNIVWNYIVNVMLIGSSSVSDCISPSGSLTKLSKKMFETGVDFEGWLHKQTRLLKRYNKRWVVLRDGFLYYFHARQGVPSGVINLEGVSLVDYEKKSYSFQLILPNHTYIFAATGDVEKDMWWEQIQKQIHRNPDIVEREFLFHGDEVPLVSIEDFTVLKLLGRGSYGKVIKVRKNDTGEVFAMKQIKKDSLMQLLRFKDLDPVVERRVLQKIDHPFIVKLHYAFHTDTKLCFVMDFLSGGVLLWHMNNRRMKPNQGLMESQVVFYSAELVVALQHLHDNNIIYRDLKPENVMLDRDGHVVLTDFGLATTKSTGFLTCGSAPFMAPELVKHQPYTFSVDWWSLGVLIYEMLSASRLFGGPIDNSIFKKILSQTIIYPSYFSPNSKDLLSQVLCRDPEKRANGHTLRQHKWFENINWTMLEDKEIEPPFKPDVSGSDLKYFHSVSGSVDESVVTKDPISDNSGVQDKEKVQMIHNIVQEFPLNKNVTILSKDVYGQPIINRDGSVVH